MEANKRVLIILSVLLFLATILILFIGKKSQDKKYVNIYSDVSDALAKPGNAVNIDTKEDITPSAQNQKPIPDNYDIIIPIYKYNYIYDDAKVKKTGADYIAVSKLEQQFKYISDNGYQTIFVSDLSHIGDYNKPVILSFDKATTDFYNYVLPLLKKYNLKANLGVATDYIDKTSYISSKQLKEVVESQLVEIDSKGVSSIDLTKVDSNTLVNELKNSKEKFKELFNIEVKTIDYPDGLINDTVVNQAKNYYVYGLSQVNEMYYSTQDDILKMPRIYVKSTTDINSFTSYLQKINIKKK